MGRNSKRIKGDFVKRKLKIKNILVAAIILVCIIVVIVFLLSNINKKDETEVKEKITISIGENVPKESDYVTDSSSDDIEWDDLEIEDGKIYHSGVYTGKILVDGKYKIIKLVVLDKQKPVIECDKNISITVGQQVDLFSFAKITDDSHDELSKEIVGEYDINKAGYYDIEYVVEDASGNKVTKSVTLQVKNNNASNNNVSNVTSNVTPLEENNSNNNAAVNTNNTTSKGFKIEQKDGIYYIGGILIANKSYPLPSSYNPGTLLNEFNIAFTQMKDAAAKDGVDLKVVSGFRSYSTQTRLYNNYVARDGKAEADRYSARPGYSEHQSGLAADLNEVSDTFGETKAGKWLAQNCWKYGFILRYPKGKESITGYMYESWHFRYIGDLKVTETLYNNGNWITLEEYLGIDSVYR